MAVRTPGATYSGRPAPRRTITAAPRMFASISHWRPRHLLGAWIAYWIFVVLVGLGPAIPLIWRISRAGGHGVITGGAADGAITLTIASGAIAWTRSLSYGALTLLLVVPPILLWVAWAAARPRRVV